MSQFQERILSKLDEWDQAFVLAQLEAAYREGVVEAANVAESCPWWWSRRRVIEKVLENWRS